MREKFALSQDEELVLEIDYTVASSNPRVFYKGEEVKPVNHEPSMIRGLAYDLPEGRFTIKLESHMWMSYIGLRLNGKHIPKSPAAPIFRARPSAYMAWILGAVIVIYGLLGLTELIASQNRFFELVFVIFGFVYAGLGLGVYRLNHICSMTLVAAFTANAVWGVMNGGAQLLVLYIVPLYFFIQGLLATRELEQERLVKKDV